MYYTPLFFLLFTFQKNEKSRLFKIVLDPCARARVDKWGVELLNAYPWPDWIHQQPRCFCPNQACPSTFILYIQHAYLFYNSFQRANLILGLC